MTTLSTSSRFWLASLAWVLAGSLAACDGDSDGDDLPAGMRAVVVAGDFAPGAPGVLTVLGVESETAKVNAAPAGAIGSDPILRHGDGELLIVNRLEAHNVTILDDRSLKLIAQISTGDNSNPTDVAVVGNKLYVSTFAGEGLVVLTRGSTAVKSIELLAGDPSLDPDGRPNCNSVFAAGGKVYVSCGLLDEGAELFPPRGPGVVYVVDPATDQVTATLRLSTANPIAQLEQIPAGAPHAGDLLLPTVTFATGVGCVERITPGATPAAPGCLVTNADLGGYASRLTFQIESGIAYMLISVPRFPNADLKLYDLASELVWAGSISPATQVAGDVVVCPSGEMIVADTTTGSNGLRIYFGTSELTTSPLAVGLPPMSTRGLVCYDP